MENKKEKIADFKTAISSTVRSLSNSDKIEVSMYRYDHFLQSFIFSMHQKLIVTVN